MIVVVGHQNVASRTNSDSPRLQKLAGRSARGTPCRSYPSRQTELEYPPIQIRGIDRAAPVERHSRQMDRVRSGSARDCPDGEELKALGEHVDGASLRIGNVDMFGTVDGDAREDGTGWGGRCRA